MSTLTAEDFDRVVRDNHRRFVRAAYAELGNWADAEEAVQNVLVTAWQKRDQVDSLISWFYVALRYEAMRIRSARWRYVPTGGWEDERGFEFVDCPVQPTGGLCTGDPETAEQVREALKNLPASRRHLVELHCLDGLSVAQIAELKGWTKAAVSSSLWMAFDWLTHPGKYKRKVQPPEVAAQAFVDHPDLFASLPPRQQDVVRLRYFERLPRAEVEKRLGISTEAARAAINKARKKARRFLDSLNGSGSAVTA